MAATEEEMRETMGLLMLIVAGLVTVLPALALGAGKTGDLRTSGNEDGLTNGAASWTLFFHDGSNNAFVVSVPAPGAVGSLEYRPVRPEESSSGVYSGGEPRAVPVPASAAIRLQDRIEQLARATGSHVGNRVMGSGAFSVRAGASQTRFLLGPGRELDEFTGFLRRLLTGEPHVGP